MHVKLLNLPPNISLLRPYLFLRALLAGRTGKGRPWVKKREPVSAFLPAAGGGGHATW